MAHNLLCITILLLLISRKHLILMISPFISRLKATFCSTDDPIAIVWFSYDFIHEVFVESGSYDATMVSLALGVLLLVHTSILNSCATITNSPNLFPIATFRHRVWYRWRIFSSYLISLLLALRLLISRRLVDSTHQQFSAINIDLSIIEILSPQIEFHFLLLWLRESAITRLMRWSIYAPSIHRVSLKSWCWQCRSTWHFPSIMNWHLIIGSL